MTPWDEKKNQDRGNTSPIGGFEEYSSTEPVGKTEPIPQQGRATIFEEYSPTMPIVGGNWPNTGNPNSVRMEVPDYDRRASCDNTGAVPDFGGNGGRSFETMPIGGGFGGGNGASVPPTMPPVNSGFGGYQTYPQNIGTTEPAPANGIPGFLPTVGWLVCVEGPDRGRDYRVHDGYNKIGRSASMDICINGDTKISREDHARIAYDPDERKFFFAPADGRNLVKLNGKTLMMAAELKPYDTVTIGSSKLKFIPFCGPEFSWTDDEI